MVSVQRSLSNFMLRLKRRDSAPNVCGGWVAPEYLRIPGVRFAPEVPVDECSGCPLAAKQHPLVPDVGDDGSDVYQLLCTRDCLAAGVPLEKDWDGYRLKEECL